MTTMSRRTETETAYRVGPYWFNPDARTMIDDRGAKIPLTRKETRLLDYLRRAEGRSVDRARLLSEVWGYRPSMETHTIETHVYRIRKKIERPGRAAQILVHAEGGYRLNR